MSQPLPFPAVLILPQGWSPKRYSGPEISLLPRSPAFKKICEEPFKQDLTGSIFLGLSLAGLLKGIFAGHFVQ